MERRRYTCDGKPDGRWIAVMIPGLELSFRMALMDDDIHTHTHTHTHTFVVRGRRACYCGVDLGG